MPGAMYRTILSDQREARTTTVFQPRPRKKIQQVGGQTASTTKVTKCGRCGRMTHPDELTDVVPAPGRRPIKVCAFCIEIAHQHAAQFDYLVRELVQRFTQ